VLTNEIENHIHLDTMAASKCPPRRLLVQGAFSTVEHCRCGAVYLSVGPISLRLEASALRELAEVILEASFILSGEAAVAEAGFARRSQSAGGAGPSEGPALEEGSGGDPVVETSPPSKLN
jgi:hypothetical protein